MSKAQRLIQAKETRACAGWEDELHFSNANLWVTFVAPWIEGVTGIRIRVNPHELLLTQLFEARSEEVVFTISHLLSIKAKRAAAPAAGKKEFLNDTDYGLLLLMHAHNTLNVSMIDYVLILLSFHSIAS